MKQLSTKTEVTHYIHNANNQNKEPIPPVKAWCNEKQIFSRKSADSITRQVAARYKKKKLKRKGYLYSPTSSHQAKYITFFVSA